MAYRSSTSQANFLGGQTDAVVKAPIPNLVAYVTSLVGLRPYALRLVGAAEAGLTIKKAVIQDPTVGKKRYPVYQGDHIPLADFMTMLAEDAARLGYLAPHKYISDHGLEIEFTYTSTGAKLHTFVWGMQNQTVSPGQATPDNPFPGVNSPAFFGLGNAGATLVNNPMHSFDGEERLWRNSGFKSAIQSVPNVTEIGTNTLPTAFYGDSLADHLLAPLGLNFGQQGPSGQFSGPWGLNKDRLP